MSGPYRGETPGKTVTRCLLHCIAADLFGTYRPPGLMFALSGHEALDAEALLHIVRCKPGDVFLVDKDDEHEELIRRSWKKYPGIRTMFGEARTAIESVDKIAFANLDLMGYMNWEKGSPQVVRRLRPKLSDGGILAFTFFRSRENGMGDTPKFPSSEDGPDMVRLQYYEDRLLEILETHEHHYERIGAIQYQSKCPMTVLVLRKKIPGEFFVAKNRLSWDSGIVSPIIIKKATFPDVLAQTRRMLLARGVPARRVRQLITKEVTHDS